jgi:hypothetical protein
MHGAGGIEVSIGKLAIYTAAGVDPVVETYRQAPIAFIENKCGTAPTL